jgi:hypothetical protein
MNETLTLNEQHGLKVPHANRAQQWLEYRRRNCMGEAAVATAQD